MKRETKMLLEKACDSLLLSIELFNRPHDRGRVSGVLIQLDHAFEMLLKATILHKGGKIREKRAKETIGFDACVRRGLTDGKIKFLTEEQAITLQTINGLRDAAQHHLLEISEGQLYVHAQSGVTLFRDLLKKIFDQELAYHLPARVLPVSASPPTDLTTLFNSEVSEICKLLRPGKRRRIEAQARLRPLALLDATIRGEKGQPTAGELGRIGQELLAGTQWPKVFIGVAAVEITPDGSGPSLSLRLTKKEGIPIHLVPEGTPGAYTVAVKRIDELGFYNLGAKQLAENLELTMSKVIAIVDHLGMRGDSECYKEFRIGSVLHKRYSQKAIDRIKAALENETVDDIWAKYRKKLKKLSE
ncbi:MAG: hypothetical protein JW718_08185 [Desulfovibrionaceae bacterium]|nr:hypothetical protein [Desulfovibrionaceae bacterium]